MVLLGSECNHPHVGAPKYSTAPRSPPQRKYCILSFYLPGQRNALASREWILNSECPSVLRIWTPNIIIYFSSLSDMSE